MLHTHSPLLHAVFLQASHIFKASGVAINFKDLDFMDYRSIWLVSLKSPSKYAAVAVVENSADKNYGQIL